MLPIFPARSDGWSQALRRSCPCGVHLADVVGVQRGDRVLCRACWLRRAPADLSYELRPEDWHKRFRAAALALEARALPLHRLAALQRQADAQEDQALATLQAAHAADGRRDAARIEAGSRLAAAGFVFHE